MNSSSYNIVPLVSVLVPVYNVERYVAKCIDSIISQTYRELQIVLFDDGSTDHSLDICHHYASQDNRIEVYHQENQGVATTRNNLLGKIKGDFVLFVDSDDWIEKDMVEYLVNLTITRDADFVMCTRVINATKPSRTPPIIFDLNQERAIEDFLHHDYFVGSLCNKLFKTSLLHNLKFHCGISYGEDALFCWQILQNVKKVVVSSKQLYHYRMNEDSISHQSFGEKKFSGHQTWSIITEDVRKSWPQYMDLVLGTFAMSDMYLLQAASQSGYPCNDLIRELQHSVRIKHKYLDRIKKKDFKRWIYATIIMYWYGFGRLYYKLHFFKSYL